VVVLALCGGGAFWWYQRALSPRDASSDVRVLLTIAPGTSATSISEQLEARGVIRSALAFRLHLWQIGRTSDLQAGTFVLQPAQSVSDVILALADGKAQESVLRVMEGGTVAQLDRELARRGLAATGALLACDAQCDLSRWTFLPPAGGQRRARLEGYLFPDSYFVSAEGFTVPGFVDRLLQTFQERVLPRYEAKASRSDRSLADIVVMASLIERESRLSAERRIVSGILWKRLQTGMRLDVDAAVRYAVDKPTEPLTRTDLDSASPYNLRRVGGLPPGAIGSPSLDSLEAAMAPEESPYLYYLHAPDGQIHYGRTLEEHNRNVATYLR
jgi:UPF0755 protein